MAPKNTNEQILVVDDDQMIRWTLREALHSWGFATVEASLAAEAVKQFQAELPAAVLLDIDLPDGSGLDVLREIKREHPDAIVIMITGNVQVDNTISALRGGAYDFIAKPISLEELRVTLRNAIEARQLRREVAQVRKERAREFNFKQIVGESPAMKKMLGLAAKVAESEVSSVLLQGESGTGKDLVAKAIHYGSERAEGPFVAINCAALPATLIESGGQITGSTHEPCALPGCPRKTHLALLSGHRQSRTVAFVKTYDPPGFGYGAVSYRGDLNGNATEIAGT